MQEASGAYTSPFLDPHELKFSLRARKVSGAFEKRATGYGDSLELHCASLLYTIFTSLARAHECVRVQNTRDFSQTKLKSEINALFS